MACAGCSTTQSGSRVSGCNSNGGCGAGSCSCNRMNTYDWLSLKEIKDVDEFRLVEVSYKQGARKEFHFNPPYSRAVTGDMVAVESGGGYDIGQITLSGELVRMQMKKKRARIDAMYSKVLRPANERDLERLAEARKLELGTMVRAKAISRTLGLNMKIGDVEYQGDLRKATFYYTADGRVDFRELIRHFAKEFRVKIEMRQIGARQESARIGGLGSCGRELCCSTWLTDFKSVSTSAARYQNLAINQAKLSGQCGRLKCCLNYELDTYMDALEKFPKKADVIETEHGKASLIKVDIFKGVMYYFYKSGAYDRGKTITLEKDKVHEILEMNKKGVKPADLMAFDVTAEPVQEEVDFESVHDVIDLPAEKRKKKKRRNKKRTKGPGGDGKPGDSRRQQDAPSPKTGQGTPQSQSGGQGPNQLGEKDNQRSGGNRTGKGRGRRPEGGSQKPPAEKE